MLYLGLGSNMGNKLSHIESALNKITLLLGPTRVSSIYQTAPQDFLDQPDFYNAVVEVQCTLAPPEVLKITKSIEANLGRVRDPKIKKGPRLIDIDILFYDELIYTSQDLSIPHPSLKNRQFVLIPLCELQPDMKDPLTHLFYKDILEELEDQGVYLLGKDKL